MLRLRKGIEAATTGLKQQVYSTLKDRIIHGELKPGATINEREVVEEFGISRTPVREALNRLEVQGWIRTEPRRGTVVNEVSLEDIKQIFPIRIALETLALDLAFGKIDDNVIDHLEDNLRGMREAASDDDLSRVVDLDIDIHFTILEVSENDRLHKMALDLINFIRRYGDLSIAFPGRVVETIHEQSTYLKALKERDLHQARVALTLHLRNTSEMVKRMITSYDILREAE